MSSTFDTVADIIAETCDIPRDEIKPESHFAFDLGAESVQSVELVAAFEEEFGIEMDEDAALSVSTVSGAVDFITKVCKEQGATI